MTRIEPVNNCPCGGEMQDGKLRCCIVATDDDDVSVDYMLNVLICSKCGLSVLRMSDSEKRALIKSGFDTLEYDLHLRPEPINRTKLINMHI